MDHALKLVLVDPHHTEYKDLSKTSEGQAKAGLSLEMRKILEASGVPDDIKLKTYNRAMSRFLNVRDTTLEQPLPPINWVEHQQKGKAKRKKQTSINVQPTRKSERKRRKWVKF